MMTIFGLSSWFSSAEQEELKMSTVEDSLEGVLEQDDANYEATEQLLKERRLLHSKTLSLKAKLRQMEQMLEERPAAWVPDSARTSCVGCGGDFNLFNRRHHCRSCGDVFDEKCSSKRMELPAYQDAGMVRVCDTCYKQHQNDEAEEDIDCSVLAALGLGTEFLNEQSFMLSASPVRRRRKTVVQIICSAPNKKPHENIVGTFKDPKTGKLRSEIPPAPPFPSVMPKSISAPIGGLPLRLPAIAKSTKAFVPPKTNVKPIDIVELQNGIARLRKTPRTPAKIIGNNGPDTGGMSDLKNSLKRRRKFLEDSLLSIAPDDVPLNNKENDENVLVNEYVKPTQSGKGSKMVSFIDGLKDKVLYKESPIPVLTPNTSWID